MRPSTRLGAKVSFSNYTLADFAVSPLMFYYEVTTACDLVCKHCRASAQESAHPEQLNTEQSLALIDQVASFPRKPNLVLTGGDPLKRPDIYQADSACGFVRFAGRIDSLRHAAGQPRRVGAGQRRGRAVARRQLGWAGRCKTHDSFRGWEGSFDRTMRMLVDARQLGLGVQVNTTITRRNFHLIEEMATLLSAQGIAMWSVFFLIPVGRGIDEERISGEQYEEAFERLWIQAGRQPFAIKTTEAPHYRRFVLQRNGDPLAGPQRQSASRGAGSSVADAPRSVLSRERKHRAPLGVRDGNGIMFVSHVGEIYPAGFLPLQCGRFPENSVVDAYQNHPSFVSLRDPEQFGGECGICEYRYVCGGSRSRAYAVTGDPLGAEPDCVYEPGQVPLVDPATL